VTAYLEACSAGIAKRGGEVTKFLGDGVMAYFDADDVDDALQSCLDIQAELKRIRDEAPPKSALGLVYSGFGLVVGPVIEGSMGSSVKMDYTIIGQPVNSAARVEALTRTLHRPILMTEAVADAAEPTWAIQTVGAFDIGRNTPTGVCALASGVDEASNMREAVAESLAMVRAR